MPCFRAVIFDLDGTLIDSYAAIASALNVTRASFRLEPLPLAVVREHVGRGLESLIADLVGTAHVEIGVQRFRQAYERVFLEQTSVLDGVGETVRELAEAGVLLAVASNKPERFGRRIVEHFGLDSQIRIVLGPTASIPPKPEPAMLMAACQALGQEPRDCLYVGDMPLDVESARRAGLDHRLVPSGSVPLELLLEIPGARIVPQLRMIQQLTS